MNLTRSVQTAVKLEPPVAVVILAAGFSTRMGRPKLLLPWGETTVVGHLIEEWQKLGVDQIAIVCHGGDDALSAELDALDFPAGNRIVNHKAHEGMFSSIRCAANWTGWQPGVSAWVFVLGDQPHLRFSTLQKLVDFQQRHPGSICQPSQNGRARHPVIVPKKVFARLKRSSTTSLKDFLNQTSFPLNKCSIDDPGLSLDLDSPEDYRIVKNLLCTNYESS